jgi:hypothetical protein
MSALTTSGYHGLQFWSPPLLVSPTWRYGCGRLQHVAFNICQTTHGIRWNFARKDSRLYLSLANPLHEGGVAFVEHRVHISRHSISWSCVSGPRPGAFGLPGHDGRWRNMSQLHLKRRYIGLGKCVQVRHSAHQPKRQSINQSNFFCSDHQLNKANFSAQNINQNTSKPCVAQPVTLPTPRLPHPFLQYPAGLRLAAMISTMTPWTSILRRMSTPGTTSWSSADSASSAPTQHSNC